MPFALLLSLLPSMLGIAGSPPAEEVRTLVVEQEVIMRVPVSPRPMPRAFAWEERKGPKCIPAAMIRGAMLSDREHVDFVLFDRSRMRAHLSEECPGLDYYAGFYLRPEDGEVCAKRDEVHLRSGASCRIERFRRLVPKFRR